MDKHKRVDIFLQLFVLYTHVIPSTHNHRQAIWFGCITSHDGGSLISFFHWVNRTTKPPHPFSPTPPRASLLAASRSVVYSASQHADHQPFVNQPLQSVNERIEYPFPQAPMPTIGKHRSVSELDMLRGHALFTLQNQIRELEI